MTHFDDYDYDYDSNTNYTSDMMYSPYSLYVADRGGYYIGQDNENMEEDFVISTDDGYHDKTTKDLVIYTDDGYHSMTEEQDVEYTDLSSDVETSSHTDDEMSDDSMGYRKKMKKRNRFMQVPLSHDHQKDEIRTEEINLELTVLPKPSFMMHSSSEEPRMIQDPVHQDVAPDPPKMVWKAVEEDVGVERDPWAFLENPVQENPKRTSSVSNNHHQHASNSSNSSNSLSNQNIDTNRLCKYKDECRMNKNGRCYMIHSLAEWKPRMCKFMARCRRKQSCGYHHPDIPIKDYLQLMINRQDSIYAKNASLYSLYLS